MWKFGAQHILGSRTLGLCTSSWRVCLAPLDWLDLAPLRQILPLIPRAQGSSRFAPCRFPAGLGGRGLGFRV